MIPAFAYPYVNVYHHTGPWSAIETQWLGFATGAEFRTAVEQALQLAHHHRAKGWIADDRLLGAIRPRDLDWTHDEVLLGMESLGVQRLALLESQDGMNRRTIDAMYQRAQEAVSFEIRRFDDIGTARAWATGGE